MFKGHNSFVTGMLSVRFQRFDVGTPSHKPYCQGEVRGTGGKNGDKLEFKNVGQSTFRVAGSEIMGALSATPQLIMHSGLTCC